MSERKPVVLFICTSNSCRSQMAEALLRHHAPECFDVCSAGMQPASEVHPLAIQVMKEIGIDIAGYKPKPLTTYLGRMLPAYVIILCPQAAPICPSTWPGSTTLLRWSFEDPAAIDGDINKKLAAFRTVRDKIEAAIITWLRSLKVEAVPRNRDVSSTG